mmetsp:Transcript_160245/g.514150  ORF Transcript_160245/g.514150 Transcript_160245/m.514150 type:complete len:445 (+) Transcript_160245:1323-2657(+)
MFGGGGFDVDPLLNCDEHVPCFVFLLHLHNELHTRCFRRRCILLRCFSPGRACHLDAQHRLAFPGVASREFELHVAAGRLLKLLSAEHSLPQLRILLVVVLVHDGEHQVVAGAVAPDLAGPIPDDVHGILNHWRLDAGAWSALDLDAAEGVRAAAALALVGVAEPRGGIDRHDDGLEALVLVLLILVVVDWEPDFHCIRNAVRSGVRGAPAPDFFLLHTALGVGFRIPQRGVVREVHQGVLRHNRMSLGQALLLIIQRIERRRLARLRRSKGVRGVVLLADGRHRGVLIGGHLRGGRRRRRGAVILVGVVVVVLPRLLIGGRLRGGRRRHRSTLLFVAVVVVVLPRFLRAIQLGCCRRRGRRRFGLARSILLVGVLVRVLLGGRRGLGGGLRLARGLMVLRAIQLGRCRRGGRRRFGLARSILLVRILVGVLLRGRRRGLGGGL